MKCPTCGAENGDGSPSCGDYGLFLLANERNPDMAAPGAYISAWEGPLLSEAVSPDGDDGQETQSGPACEVDRLQVGIQAEVGPEQAGQPRISGDPSLSEQPGHWSPARKIVLAALAAILILGMAAGGAYLWLRQGWQAYEAGSTARQSGDCAAAIAAQQQVVDHYPQWTGPFVDLAAQGLAECRAYQQAGDLATTGDHARAVAAYAAFVRDYPASPLRSAADEGLYAAYLAWGEAHRATGEFLPAVAVYEDLQRAAQTEARRAEAAEQAAATLLAWARSQATAERPDYTAALGTYQLLLEDYPTSSASFEARKELPGIELLTADQARARGQWEMALHHYEQVIALEREILATRDGPSFRPGRLLALKGHEAWQGMAATHLAWGEAERAHGRYESALVHYQTVLSSFAASEAASRATEALIQTTYDWGRSLQAARDYEAAVERYQTLISDFPDSARASVAKEDLATVWCEWAGALRAGQDYEMAIERYQIVLSDFSASQVVSQAVEGLAWAYYDWGQSLQATADYRDALPKYETILADPRLSAVVTDVASAAVGTTIAWAQELSATHAYSEAVVVCQRGLGITGTRRLSEVSTSLASIYRAWGKQLAAEEAYSDAIDRFDQVLNDPDLKAHAPAVVDDAAATYYAWGQARGSTDEALDAYNKLRQRFPKSVWATRATEQVASIYVGRADALRKKGQYAKAIQSYERVIDDYPHAGAVDRARTGVVEAETAWRRNLAGRLVDAIAEADRGADRLDGCYRQLDAGQKVKCLDVYLIGFGDTGLSIPDRFPALQAAYRQYRSALGILDEVKKILIDRCKSSWKYVTQQEVDTGRTRIKNTRGKLGQAKTAAEAAKAR